MNQEPETEKKVIKTKTYTIVVQEFDNNTHTMTRTNDGFGTLELLGLSDFIAIEIREQMIGHIKPDIIVRQVLADNTPSV